jgi:FkbM family methyltransferase
VIPALFEELAACGYRPRTLLDVGAHLGHFSTAFCTLFPGCVPTLVEPNPFCGEELEKLGLEVLAAAASDTPGRAKLFLTREWLTSTGTSLYRENTAWFRDETVVRCEVDTVRLDDALAGRRFDVVKIDTQGAELDVLVGGETVIRQADFVLLEVSLVEYNLGGARAEAVFQQMDRMGFRCMGPTEFHRLAGAFDGNLIQVDFLFERASLRPLWSPGPREATGSGA